MKTIKFLAVILSLMVGIGIMAGPAGASLLVNGDNNIFFKNYETVFDSSGNEIEYKQGDTDPHQLVVGDHFVGIIDVQEIIEGGNAEHWSSSATEQLTGIFVHRIEAIYDPLATPATPDPYSSGSTGLTHIVLGAPYISTFNTITGYDTNGDPIYAASGSFNTNLINDESLALYYESGSVTQFESNGTIVDDIAKATDGGNLWMTFGYSDGADGIYDDNSGGGGADNDGYNYSHTEPLGGTVDNFTGENWAAFNVLRNPTNVILTGDMNDPNELEIGGPLGVIPGLMTDFYLSGEFEGNVDWLNVTGYQIDPNDPNAIIPVYGKSISPWVFASNDPGHLGVVPEPATMLLLGSGLIGLAGFARKKSKKVS